MTADTKAWLSKLDPRRWGRSDSYWVTAVVFLIVFALDRILAIGLIGAAFVVFGCGEYINARTDKQWLRWPPQLLGWALLLAGVYAIWKG